MENRKTCAIVQDLLPAYMDKLTKQETTSFVDAHLTDCEACRRVCRAMAGELPAEAVQAEQIVQRLNAERDRRRAWGWGILAVCLLLAVICLLPLPRRINAAHEGVLWRCGAPEEAQNTGVTVTGIYYDYLFRADAFTGSVRVEVCPETHGNTSVTAMVDGQYGIWRENENGLLEYFGGMFVRRDGSVLVLISEEGHWDAETGKVCTAPASTREEAVTLTNELAKELSPNWLGTWNFE